MMIMGSALVLNTDFVATGRNDGRITKHLLIRYPHIPRVFRFLLSLRIDV